MSEQEAGPYCAFECPYTEEAHTAAYPDHDWVAPSPALTREVLAAALRHVEQTRLGGRYPHLGPGDQTDLADELLSCMAAVPPPSSTREEPAP